MKFAVRHEIKGRIRIHICGKRMSCRDADILQYYLDGLEGVYQAGIYPGRRMRLSVTMESGNRS